MLYIVLFVLFLLWAVLLMRKSRMSWHSLAAAYAIAFYCAAHAEVVFNELLDLYRFPARLVQDPVYDNILGMIFSDVLILPVVFIVVLHYARKDHPFRTALAFLALMFVLEVISVKLQYVVYYRWHIGASMLFYGVAFFLTAKIAPRVMAYDPPLPQWVLLLVFGYTVMTLTGVLLSMPVLRLYQYRPGLFQDYMADTRFADNLSGEAIVAFLALLLPQKKKRAKIVYCLIGAFTGTAFALSAYYKEWLIYHNWNHFFMALRYIVPVGLIYLYDRWEGAYQARL